MDIQSLVKETNGAKAILFPNIWQIQVIFWTHLAQMVLQVGSPGKDGRLASLAVISLYRMLAVVNQLHLQVLEQRYKTAPNASGRNGGIKNRKGKEGSILPQVGSI